MKHRPILTPPYHRDSPWLRHLPRATLLTKLDVTTTFHKIALPGATKERRRSGPGSDCLSGRPGRLGGAEPLVLPIYHHVLQQFLGVHVTVELRLALKHVTNIKSSLLKAGNIFTTTHIYPNESDSSCCHYSVKAKGDLDTRMTSLPAKEMWCEYVVTTL